MTALYHLLRPWIQLVKAPLCLSVAGTALFGAILHTPLLNLSTTALFTGVFFLSCGAAGLNSVQERTLDRLFSRTCSRPLVVGSITASQSLLLTIFLISLGIATLIHTTNWLSAALAIAAIVLYNGVYTPLKKRSAFALFLGGIAGALPPLIGWTAAGGRLAESTSGILFSLFILWQIPHYSMVLLVYKDEYHAIAIPSLIRQLSERTLRQISSIWICALIVVDLILAVDPRICLANASRFCFVILAGIFLLCAAILASRNASSSVYRLLYLVLTGSFFLTLFIVALLQLQRSA